MAERVGLFGLWYGRNYGSQLTYFALAKILEDLGVDVTMIDNPLARHSRDDAGFVRSHPYVFGRERYQITTRLPIHELGALNDQFDTVMVGSDQLWNYGLSRPYEQAYYLDFVHPDRRRIAYATSFGSECYNGPKDTVPTVAADLRAFSGISVRDIQSQRICAQEFGVLAPVASDPVMVCPKNHWQTLIDESGLTSDTPFLFAYVLDPNPAIGEALKTIAAQRGLRLVVALDEADSVFDANVEALGLGSDPVLAHPTAQELLWHFRQSDLVITDSFHGTCFSLVFDREFVTFRNTRRAPHRFHALLDQLGLGHRLVTKIESLAKVTQGGQAIDYPHVNAKLAEQARASRAWLKAALDEPIGHHVPLVGTQAALTAVTAWEGEGLDALSQDFRALAVIEDPIIPILVEEAFVSEPVIAAGEEGGEGVSPDFTVSSPTFEFNAEGWHQQVKGGATVLTVDSGRAVLGSHAAVNLPQALVPGREYEMHVTWSSRTVAGEINWHIKNSTSGAFQVLRHFRGDDINHDDLRTDSVTFSPQGPGYDQFVLGAIHVQGDGAYEAIASLEVHSTGRAAVNAGAVAGYTEKADAELDRIRTVVALCHEYGIKEVVLSPGGRDVDLVRFFEGSRAFTTYPIVDERDAGYFAIGLATSLGRPVAMCCTSGTAASNYMPAVTEAYCQGVPLVVLTADRHPAFLGQLEDQTIPQVNMFAAVTKKSVTLPTEDTALARWQLRRQVCEALLETQHHGSGPVHINVPIMMTERKPPSPELLKLPHIPPILRASETDNSELWGECLERLQSFEKILIHAGQLTPTQAEDMAVINQFAEVYGAVIATDHLSNLHGSHVVHPYRLMGSTKPEVFAKSLAPDLVISIGQRPLMNDRTKAKLRIPSLRTEHWRLDPDGSVCDQYYRLTRTIESEPRRFFEAALARRTPGGAGSGVSYLDTWRDMVGKLPEINMRRYSQYTLVGSTMAAIPADSSLHVAIGNTMNFVRDFSLDDTVKVYCNMGTNGIDGSMSSFLAQAMASPHLAFLLISDLSFFYDMNALWNKKGLGNARILLANNQSTGLLRHHLSPTITSAHTQTAEGWVRSLGWRYERCDNQADFDAILPKFVSTDGSGPMLIEAMC